MTQDILTLDEPLPGGARVLFSKDRFPPAAYGTGMICRLLYRDRTLIADGPTMMDHPPNLDDYDRVFDYVDGKLRIVRTGPVRKGIEVFPR